MAYVDLKHLLADLALEAVRDPAGARWPAVAAAYARLYAGADPSIPPSECLQEAARLTAPGDPIPSEADVHLLINRGLLSEEADNRVALADRFLAHIAYVQRYAPRLMQALADLRKAGPVGVSAEIRAGAALFNAGLFFECHEWFEGVWKATSGPAKGFYHGIVQAAAAFYHYEKHNTHGCRTLMRKARGRLASYPGLFLGVDLAGFEEGLARWAAHFDGDPKPTAYPRILLRPAGDSGEKK